MAEQNDNQKLHTTNKNETHKKEDAGEALHKQNNQLKSSTIANRMGKTKTIVINKGDDDEYRLTLQFPGVARAAEIRDDCVNQYGNVRVSDFMKEAIQDIIVSPRIHTLSFWNNRRGFDEVASDCLQFLADGIDG